MITAPDGSPRCDACGCTWEFRVINVTFSKCGDEAKALCTSCEGYIESGMLRRDRNDADGTPRYRWWRFEWKPGNLLPKPI
jgi:hypothetical protein